MKDQKECEWIIRTLVRAAVKRLGDQHSRHEHTECYHRINAQICLCDLMDLLPAELSLELQNDVDEAYRQAILQLAQRH